MAEEPLQSGFLLNPVVSEDTSQTLQPSLNIPASTSALAYDRKNKKYHLKPVKNFELPSKIYGSLNKYANRMFTTYKLQDIGQTGILLAGTPGSGKTLLSHILSVKARLERGIPTVIISDDLVIESGVSEFATTISRLPECVLLFDEFEKVLGSQSAQDELLPIFDGAFTSKKLVILTTNNINRISPNLTNRPSRIWYSLDFQGLEEDFIREYCQDNLDDESEIDNILHISKTFAYFSFDMLQALVKEMNVYQEPAHDAIKLMNIKNDRKNMRVRYRVHVDHIDKEKAKNEIQDTFSGMEFGRSQLMGADPIRVPVHMLNNSKMIGGIPNNNQPIVVNIPVPKNDLKERVADDNDLTYVYDDTENNLRVTFSPKKSSSESEYGGPGVY